MNIVLYGNGSAGNHGCEAIFRGTTELLGQNDYTILSAEPEEDCRYEMDQLARILAAKRTTKKDVRFARAYLKLKFFGDYHELDGLQYLSAIEDVCCKTNLALALGGDNYCYGNTALYDYMNTAFRRKGIRTILWGCSVEPDVVAQLAVKDDLKNYSLVVARESITCEAMKTAGVNVMQMPDPAFAMNPEEVLLDSRFEENEVIGINISPMIQANEVSAGIAYDNYKTLIEYILQNTTASIALIPHVVWGTNDDRIPLRRLYEEMNQDPRLILIEDHTAPQLKYIISKCSFFVGARTHATIAAYSTGVPTAVIGYSVKARGIARDLFGKEDGYVIPVQDLRHREELTQMFCELYERREEIRDHLHRYLPIYRKGCADVLMAVRRIGENEEE